jgi:hypothetical protein
MGTDNPLAEFLAQIAQRKELNERSNKKIEKSNALIEQSHRLIFRIAMSHDVDGEGNGQSQDRSMGRRF